MKKTALVFILALGIAAAQQYYYGSDGTIRAISSGLHINSPITVRDGNREVVITPKQLVDYLAKEFPVTTYPEKKGSLTTSGDLTLTVPTWSGTTDGTTLELKQ